jgi:hypothetical protein
VNQRHEGLLVASDDDGVTVTHTSALSLGGIRFSTKYKNKESEEREKQKEREYTVISYLNSRT